MSDRPNVIEFKKHMPKMAPGTPAKAARRSTLNLIISMVTLTIGCLLFGATAVGRAEAADDLSPGCDVVGQWMVAGNGPVDDPVALMRSMAADDVALLGENHVNADHHRWQLHTLAALHGLRPDMSIAFEMFPRSKQAVLNQWVAGELTEQEFLRDVAWSQVWGYDSAQYLPLFHFARLHRIPMIAMNVDRDLVSRVAREGWQSVPAEHREGVSNPKPASAAYRRSLAEVYAIKARMRSAPHGEESEAASVPSAEELADVDHSPAFGRFVEAQLTWDRAMAEAIVSVRNKAPGRLVVGIVGRGHVEYGWGIPYQLADLGIEEATVLLPIDATTACGGLDANSGDAFFAIAPTEQADASPPPPPRLGIRMQPVSGGVRIAEVVPGTVAAQSGLAAEDVIVSVAGTDITTIDEVATAVRRQPPGTWLPITVLRRDASIDVVARFPPRGASPE